MKNLIIIISLVLSLVFIQMPGFGHDTIPDKNTDSISTNTADSVSANNVDSIVSVPNTEIMNNAISNSNSGELNCQVVAEIYLPINVDTSKARKIAMAAFLLVVEASLGYWLIQSDDRTEKILAGSMITVIFLVFLFIALKIAQTTYFKNILTSKGVGEIKPANSSVKENELHLHNNGVVVGPGNFKTER